MCKDDRRGGCCVSTQVLSDLDTRRSAKSEDLERRARTMSAGWADFDVAEYVVGRIAGRMRDSSSDGARLLRAAMLYRMEVLYVRCYLSLGSGAGVAGTPDCEWSGVNWTRMLKSEPRSSIVRLLRIVHLFNQSKVIHQSVPYDECLVQSKQHIWT